MESKKSYEEFVSARINTDDPEPVCPFSGISYCNDAYSEACYKCDTSRAEYDPI